MEKQDKKSSGIVLTVEENAYGILSLVKDGKVVSIKPPQPRFIVFRSDSVNAATRAALRQAGVVGRRFKAKSLESGGRETAEYTMVKYSRAAENALSNNFIDYAHETLADQSIIHFWDKIVVNACTRPLKLLFFDIEVYTDGSGIFPKPETSPIVIISYAIVNDTDDGWKNYTVSSFAMYDESLKDKNKQDAAMITAFMEMVKRENPDVISGYNSWRFDIPYLRARAIASESPWTLDRVDTSELYILDHSSNLTGYSNPGYVRGRTSYDVYMEVARDQTIRALPDRKLDTVARHFNFGGKTGFNPENTAHFIGSKELAEYCEQDVRVLVKLAEGYFRNAKTVCELAQVPLTNYHWGAESWLEKISSARALLRRNVVSVTQNQARYPSLLLSSQGGKDRKFRAAYVDVYKIGRYGG